MVDAWRSELRDLTETFPCALSRVMRPRLVFLPPWWPVHFGAWVYLNLVMIAPGTRKAPTNARRYTLAHEYGHIYMGHTALQFAYWALLLTLLVAALQSLPVLVMTSLIGLLTVSFPMLGRTRAAAREMQADAIAVTAYGSKVALAGALWMTDQLGTLQSLERQKRLKALGWDRCRNQAKSSE